jgi:hypothetical protein
VTEGQEHLIRTYQAAGIKLPPRRYEGRHRRTVDPVAWTRRNPLLASVVLILALWAPYGALDGSGVLRAVRATHGASVALGAVSCPGESGGEILPCRWRCATMGNRRCGPDTPPVITYRASPMGEINVCMPVGRGEACTPVESDVRIEVIGDDGRLYRLAGGS